MRNHLTDAMDFSQFSCSVMSETLQPHGLQHARLPCPPLSPRVCSNSCPLSRWCHPTISPSVTPFPPALNLSQGLLQWGRSSHQVPKVLELQLQHQPFRWIFRVDLLAVQGTLESLLQHHSSEASILWHSAFFVTKLSYPHMTTGKSTALTICTFVGKVMSLLSNTLSVCHRFPSREKVSFNSMAAVTICSHFGAQENEIHHCFHFSPFCLPWSDGTRCCDLSFLNVRF